MKYHKLVLLRHGESKWNQSNQFTGWRDIGLSEKGREEASKAGELLKSRAYHFDKAYTSLLSRAQHTLDIVISKLDQNSLPIEKSWKLNERHYGALQGLNKKETMEKYGEEQVFLWRRSYHTPPPPLDRKDPTHPMHDELYKDIPPEILPDGESLENTIARVIPYWESTIAPTIKKGETVLIVAHGNSLRALIKHLDKVSNEEISQLEIPTGIPQLYELDENLQPRQRREA